MAEREWTAQDRLGVLQASNGRLVWRVDNIGASVYVSWNPHRWGFEWLSIGGPTSRVLAYETVDRQSLLEEIVTDHRSGRFTILPWDDTPFAAVPAVADQYDGNFHLHDGYVARCGCGDQSLPHVIRPLVEAWSDEHHDMCSYLTNQEGDITIETVGPHSRE